MMKLMFTHLLLTSVPELPEGIAQSNVDALCKLCEDPNLDMSTRLCSFGSYGASVMVGAHEDAATLLKDCVPFLISHHCIKHCLALTNGQPVNELTYLKYFKSVLDQLYCSKLSALQVCTLSKKL